MSLTSGDVFIRTSTRRNSAGVPVRYLQLVHNTWDPVARTTKAKVLHSFGREDEVDRAAIERLIASLSRLLNPTAELASGGAGGGGVCSPALGAGWGVVWRPRGAGGFGRAGGGPAPAATRGSSGCCSPWSPRGRSSRLPSWPP